MTRSCHVARYLVVTSVLIGFVSASAQALTLQVPMKPELTAPKLRLPDDWRPLRYAVTLRLDPKSETFHGAVDIDVEITRRTDVLWLNATEFEIDDARVTAGNRGLDVTSSTHGEDYLALSLGSALEPGKARIQITYRGKVDDTDTHGLFRQQEGDDWYVFSQFEATSARRAFPSFDEPNHKVPWQLTLTVPGDLVAVSNTREVSSRGNDDGTKTVLFAETKPLPSYLVALAIGPFDIVDGGKIGRSKTPFRILTPRGMASQAAYALEITPEIFRRIEDYFGLPHPYAKLDEVAIPHTVSFGAMENAGLITYAQTGLLGPTDQLTISQKRRLANTTAHEIAHQWFGNLVTMEFWDDIWLNEGFATWLAAKIVDDWKPEWDGEVSSIRRRSRVMGSDSLVTARQIRQPIAEPGDIDNAFDGITYGKGAATLAMFERWLGEDAFREGIRRYMRQHSWSNATSDDLLAALSAATTGEVAPAFATFLNQPGLPLVSVALTCGSKGQPATLQLTQKRFLPTGSKGSSEHTWRFPICVRWSQEGKEARACTLMSSPSATMTLTDSVGACPDWLLANDGMMGYYRTSYADDLLDRLLRDGGRQLTLPERIGVLGDVSALASAGELDMSQVLELVPSFADADSRHLVSAAASMAAGVDGELVPDELRPNYARFVNKMFAGQARELGFVAAEGEDEDTQYLRSTLLELVAELGEDEALRAEATQLARAWLDDRNAVAPDMVSTVLGLATLDGDMELFDRFHAAAKESTDRRERRRLIGAMGSFRNPAIAKRALALVLSDEFHIREATSLLWSTFSERDTRPLGWSFFKEHFATLTERMPRESLPRLAGVARNFCDPSELGEVEAFLRESMADVPGATHRLEQALEGASLCIANKQRQQPSVSAFLKRY